MEIVKKVSIGQLDDLEAWLREYAQPKDALPPAAARSITLIGQAIADFRAFSKAYLDFFFNQLSPQDQLQPERNRIWQQAVQAFDEYWTPLGEVAAQHLIRPYRDHLAGGIELAQHYLAGLGGNLPGIVVYFNKVNSIRFVPYTDVAFVAVPYSHIARKDQDWMAIPHEIGHYLYWNMASRLVDVRRRHSEIKKNIENVVRHSLADSSLPVATQDTIVSVALAWIEEIFADVVGVRLAGADFARSFRTLLYEVPARPESLTENDGTHPPLCVRAHMREHILARNGAPISGIDWEAIMQQEFGVVDLARLTIRLLPADAENVLLTKTPEELLGLFSGMADALGTIQTVEWAFPDALRIIILIAEQLDDMFGELTTLYQAKETSAGSAFDDLYALAFDDELNNNRDPIEVLLTPWLTEGGERHSHSAWSHFESHSMGAHNH